MPVLTAMTVPARQVGRGDTIDVRTVHDVQHGTKWVDIRDADGKRITRALLDQEVTISRPVPTAEEVAADKAASLQRWVERAAENASEELAAGLAATPQSLLSDLASADKGYRLLDSYAMQRLVRRQAEFDFYSRVQATLDNWTGLVGAGGELPPLAVKYPPVLAAFALQVNSIIGGFKYADPLSRSTSTMSNLLEDVERHTALSMLEGYGKGLILKMVLAEVTAEENTLY